MAEHSQFYRSGAPSDARIRRVRALCLWLVLAFGVPHPSTGRNETRRLCEASDTGEASPPRQKSNHLGARETNEV
ncbi:hypothetical protein B0H14DRAFT_2695879 [Mycena olivaceomarginata]|nr:hypothetical protein B0H14DRAFT_2747446 [Mycena olivaceomarginata]KAJ7887239.1 hypothetical protein B0H14DRAFT_2695879 [Mycena olivaceomarginata]